MLLHLNFQGVQAVVKLQKHMHPDVVHVHCIDNYCIWSGTIRMHALMVRL